MKLETLTDWWAFLEGPEPHKVATASDLTTLFELVPANWIREIELAEIGTSSIAIAHALGLPQTGFGTSWDAIEDMLCYVSDEGDIHVILWKGIRIEHEDLWNVLFSDYSWADSPNVRVRSVIVEGSSQVDCS